MWVIDRATPGMRLAIPARGAIAAVIAAAGVVIAVAGIIALVRRHTTVHPTHPERASALVIAGIYRLTRNPMYLSLALLLVAYAVWLTNPLTVVVVPLYVAYMNRFQIAAEEAALTSRFSEAYRGYQKRVRRWL